MEFNAHQVVAQMIKGKSDYDRDEWDKFQADQRAKFTPLDKIGQQVQYGQRAVALSEAALKNKLTREQKAFEKKRMAEGLMYQGLLEEAIKLNPHPEYKAKLKAIKNKKDCPHSSDMFLKERFCYHGSAYNLYACPTCGFLNAK